MKKLLKALLAIGGFIAAIAVLFVSSNKSKKEFNKKVKANNDELDSIAKKSLKIKSDKKVTKNKIKKTTAKIKSSKSKIKSTKNAKSTIKDFDKKYRNKK
tara:strand:+ start:104 stop:403 length:300 start_codon:yes stop_codon:yes gene_type:complete